MEFITEGILLGLFLAISMGPIFVTLTQASIEKGAMAGLTVGFGVWVSDIIILGFSLLTIGRINKVVNGESFQFWMGASGAIVLFIFGLMLIFKKPVMSEDQEMISMKNFATLFTKGFLINTINPFTFIFWLSVLSTYMIGRKISQQDLSILLFTIMCMIIFSDSVKVFLAKSIRKEIEYKHLVIISRAAGIGLIIFAGVMLYRVM